MIKIPFTYKGAAVKLQRDLTPSEKKTVTSKLINAGTMEVTFYQGDEPPKPVVTVTPKHPLIEQVMSMTREEKDELCNLIKPAK